MKRRLFLLIFALLTLSPLSAQPPDADPFAAWIVQPETGQLTYLDLAGTAGGLTLPIPAGYAHLSRDEFAVSPDGQIIAYVVYRAGYTQPAVTIYGIPQRAVLANFSPEGMLFTSLSVSRTQAFSADSRHLAIGYVTENGWELAVIDLRTFALAARMTDTTPGLSALVRTPDSLPIPVDFPSINRLAFVVYDLSVTRAAEYPAYVWQAASGALTETPAYGTPTIDIYGATGEIIRAGVDERLPRNENFLPDAHYNVLWRYSPALGTAAPVYNEAEWSMTGVKFIYNGRYVLVGETNGIATRHKIVDREGNLFTYIPDDQRIYDALGTRNGLLYLTLDADSAPVIIHADISNGSREAPWIGEPSSSRPLLLWVGSPDPQIPYFTDSGDYPSWAELAPALTDGAPDFAGITPPAAALIPQAELEIGGRATIATTNGDSLNVRSYFGTAYAIRAKARPGEVVDVLDGPRDADGFTWWYIRLADGRAGWAVESADGRQTLIAGENTAPVTDSAPAAPAISSGLSVGDTAAVQLPVSLDAMRLRNGPGLAFDIIFLLPDKTLLRIIGGPQRVDDLTWWEVRTPEGNAGWAAEVIGSARVLVKQ